MSPVIMVLLDVIVIIALMAAIYYLRIVARSIKIIREGRTELQQVLKEMTLAIGQAEETIQGMKRLADDKGRSLQKQMDSAQAMADELKFINQSANHLAQRLEKNVVPTAVGPAKAPAAAKPVPARTAPSNAAMSKAEKELADALAKRKAEM